MLEGKKYIFKKSLTGVLGKNVAILEFKRCFKIETVSRLGIYYVYKMPCKSMTKSETRRNANHAKMPVPWVSSGYRYGINVVV